MVFFTCFFVADVTIEVTESDTGAVSYIELPHLKPTYLEHKTGNFTFGLKGGERRQRACRIGAC